MVKKFQAIRGMNDILPEQTPYWAYLEACYRRVVQQYGYQEIRFPIVEATELFQRSVGENTDIVEKEMYTFTDRNGDSLTLRPEGTAGCVRAGIEHSLFYNQVQRLWYCGPMYRHERPQQGRYRQFHQLGVEAYGMAGPQIDAEMILISWRLWQELGIADAVQLQVNTLANQSVRAAYRQTLVDYLSQHQAQLDNDSQRRLQTNPLRILDSKNPQMQPIIANAPKLMDCLDESSQQHFAAWCQLLDEFAIPYVVNPNLVRGLDYYCYSVFEWVTDALGAQGTVCAGGRYDGLVAQLGGQATPAIGFAVGLERLILLLANVHHVSADPDVYCVLLGDEAVSRGLHVAEQLRCAIPSMKITANLCGGGFKSQFKRADKSGARWALIIAEQELAAEQVTLKDLRGGEAQQQMSLQQAITFLQQEQ